MNEHENMETWIDPELEARVVAWVGGEASPFEIAELERLTAEKPELAIFKRRIEAVHGLVGEAARPDPEPLRLAKERREKLLATLGASEKRDAKKNYVIALGAERRRLWSQQWRIVGVAAAAAVLALAVIIPSFKKERAPAELAALNRVDTDVRTSATDESKVKAMAPQRFLLRNSDQMPVAIADAANSQALRLSPQGANKSLAGFEDKSLAIKQSLLNGVAADAWKAKAPAGNAPVSTFGGTTVASGAAATTSRDAATSVNAGSLNLIAGDGSASYVAKDGAGSLTLAGNNTFGVGASGTGGLANDLKSDGDLVKMEKFTVSESLIGGYGAISTTAGSRIAFNPPASLPAPALPSETVTLSAFSVSTGGGGGRGGFSSSFGSGAKNLEEKKAPATSVVASAPMVADTVAPLYAPNDISPPVGVDANSTLAPVNERAKEIDALDAPIRHFDAPAATPSFEETSTAKEPISTFSLHVSDVAFRLAQSALARGQLPDASQMRAEEIYNAFDYGDPSPATAEKVACRIEQSAHPFLQQRNLVRIAMKVAATGRSAAQPLRLTILLDTSGSMEREDRAATVRRAMTVLVSLLDARDHVTLIGFARTPRLLAENVSGADAKQLLDLIARTPAEGGTNLEEALNLAAQLARRHQAKGEQNRIVVLTDGAANLGNADPARLATVVTTLRQEGIAFDACGIGLNGLDDAMLEPLTRQGDGRYYVLDSPEAADAGFARQLAGAFRPAAENVKLQVRFNPARVASYRLIGFEQHRLRTEDFRNDRVDAAELAADEAAVALYQIEPLPQGDGELGDVFVRFRDPATGTMVERSWTMFYDAHAPAFDRASPSMQLAGSAALVAEKLRASPLAAQFKLGDLAGVVNGLRAQYTHEARVQEFTTMFGALRRITRE